MVKAVLNAFLLLSILWGAVIYDISSHGNLESSRTGRTLKDAGLLIYVKPYYTVIENNVVTWYKWGKINFPHKEYQQFKNKTLEVTKNFSKTAIEISRSTATSVKKYTIISYDYVVSKIPPDFTEKSLKLLSDMYGTVSKYTQVVVKRVIESSIKAKNWLLENVSKDTFTWENMEKMYFETARRAGILYTDVTTWIGRKVECLMSA